MEEPETDAGDYDYDDDSFEDYDDDFESEEEEEEETRSDLTVSERKWSSNESGRRTSSDSNRQRVLFQSELREVKEALNEENKTPR